MRNTLVAILCLFSTLSFDVSAKTKIDVFHAEVPLSSDKNARKIAWGEGLEQVLIRATGDQNVATNEVIKKAMNRGSNYLSQFQYGTLNEQPSMVMDFNSAQIKSLLIEADMSYWPAERNNILVWLVDDNGNQKEIGWEQSGLQSVVNLQTAADLSGLPITLPLGDMQDLTTVSATDVWGSFMAPISEVSQRYPVDGVLVMKVSHSGEQAEVNWQLFDMDPEKIANNSQSPLTGSESGNSLDAISHAIIQVSSYYASQNQTSINQKAESGLQAHFSGITNAKEFFSLEKQLTSFNSVASVNVKTIQGSNVSFIVELFGSVDDFAKEAARKRGLTQVEAPVIETQPVDVTEATDTEINTDESALNAEVGNDTQLELTQDTTDNSTINSKPEIEQLWFDVK